MIKQAYLYCLLILVYAVTQAIVVYYKGLHDAFYNTLLVLLGVFASVSCMKYHQYIEARKEPLTPGRVHNFLSEQQWQILEERMRTMDSSGVISLAGEKYVMQLTVANKKRLTEYGFVVTTTGQQALFRGCGG